MKYITLSILSIFIFLSCIKNHPKGSKENIPFQFTFQDTINASSEAVYDTLTGNILPWWDHTFSDKPQKLYIEPFPGGGFYEFFDETGNGVKHATVTAANRGELLRLEGSLGLAGSALLLVSTIELKPINNEQTIITLKVNGSGEIKEEWPPVIEEVWRHFISERLKPYIQNNLKTK